MASTLLDPSFKRPAFRYQPLLEPDAIRLLLLYPAADVSAYLECSIEHATLSQCYQDLSGHYTALSYVWGDATKRRVVIIDGCLLYITANLHSALCHLRHKTDIVKIWADAICISQSDIAERNQQVQQMGNIYSIACQTIIYLGESSEETDDLFTELGHLFTGNRVPISVERIYSKFDDERIKKLSNGIRAISLYSWFTRVWIFQELLLSRDPWVQCGTQRVRWVDLCQVSAVIKNKSRSLHHEKAEFSDSKHSWQELLGVAPYPLPFDFQMRPNVVGHLEAMHTARCDFEQYLLGNGTGVGHSLLVLLSLRRALGVSDPRDMIYAHLGIASDSLSGHLNLEVDYQKSYVEVFTDLAIQSIGHTGDYRVLTYIETDHSSRGQKDLPSWVPDWTSKKIHNLWDLPESPSSSTCGAAAAFSFPRSHDGKPQLKCKGKIVSRVEIIQDNVLSLAQISPEEIRPAWERFIQSIEDMSFASSSDMEEVFGQGLGVGAIASLVAAGYTKFNRLKPLQSPDVYRYQTAFLKGCFSRLKTFRDRGYTPVESTEWFECLFSLVKKMGNKQYTPSGTPIHPIVFMIVLVFRFFPIPAWTPSIDHSELRVLRFMEEFQRALEGRRLSLFDSASSFPYIDNFDFPAGILVPQATQVGDFICQMDGDPRFMVLRSAEQVGNFIKEGTVFEFVGMCYADSYINKDDDDEIISGTFTLQ